MSELPWRSPLAEMYVRAGVEMGYINQDYNSRFQKGVFIPINMFENIISHKIYLKDKD